MVMFATKSPETGGYTLVDTRALLDAFDSLAEFTTLAELIQETASRLPLLAGCQGSALLQWVPEDSTYRIRAQHPPTELSTLENSPKIIPNQLLDNALSSLDGETQVPFAELAGLGLEEALS